MNGWDSAKKFIKIFSRHFLLSPKANVRTLSNINKTVLFILLIQETPLPSPGFQTSLLVATPLALLLLNETVFSCSFVQAHDRTLTGLKKRLLFSLIPCLYGHVTRVVYLGGYNNRGGNV